jgi:hypothetical protein
MKQLLWGALALAVLSAGPVSARADVITFDDLPDLGEAPVPDGYKNLHWNNFYYLNGLNYPGNPSGYGNGVVSPSNVAFPAFGDPASFSSGAPFDFLGAALTAAWNDGLQVQIDGLRNGVTLYSQTVTVNTSGPTLFDFNYLGVDTVLFTPFGGVNHGYNGGGEHFAMDNVIVRGVTPLPEPAGLTLLGLGAAVAGLGRRRWRLATA